MIAIKSLLLRFTSSPEPNPPTWPNTSISKVLIVTPEICKYSEKIQQLQNEVSDPYNPDSVNVGNTDVPKGTFTSENHFSRRRRAVLFTPGKYNIDLQVGYYSQVLGLGTSATDVVFDDVRSETTNEVKEERNGIFVSALDRHIAESGTCLNTFWRSAENFSSNVTGRSKNYAGLNENKGMQWAVSQAAPLRRVHVKTGLTLGDGAAYASGGFMANMIVDGITNEASQQQFFHRNVQFRNQENTNDPVQNGAWSLVFAGCVDHQNKPYPAYNIPKSDGKPAITVINPTVTMEKPFITLKEDKKGFELHVPEPAFRDGADKNPVGGPRVFHDGNDSVRDFSRVRVVRSDEANPTARIQQALDQGKDVILAAGIFALTSTIEVTESNRVILGIGMSTMIAPPNGSPCIHVHPFCKGVRIAGLTLEASPRISDNVESDDDNGVSCLLEWGSEGVKDPGNSKHPGGLFDLFCRVGGDTDGDRTKIFVDTMVRLHSGHIVGDNLWLWRADHAKLQPNEQPNYPDISPIFWQVEEDEFQVKRSGLEVFGDDITIYGLQVEHANGHQTVWKGDRGLVVFYQCELPYDVSQTSFGDPGFTGYFVCGKSGVTQHAVHAPGIYSNFRNHQVVVDSAIETPGHLKTSIQASDHPVSIVNPFTVLLDNKFGIKHILNKKGNKADKQGDPVFLDDTDSASL